VGIDVDIANAIAKKLGKKLKIEDVSFDSIIAGVQNDKYDFGMAGMTVTDERKKNVDFTESYAKAVQVVIVKEDSDIKSIDDISSKNKIGVQQGTTGDIYASDTVENGGYGEDAVTKYNSGPDAVQALLSDKVDCVIIDNEPAKAYVAANQGLKILDSSFADEEYAICVKKGNSQLKNDINKALKELKDDGTIDKIVSKYIK
jgi:polar amino acid transport system substrate-binding protein